MLAILFLLSSFLIVELYDFLWFNKITKMNKTIIITVGLLILAGSLFFGFQFLNPVVTNGIILFYGDGCPHCKIVDDFVSQNKIEDKVKFVKLEVWNNKNNQAILGQVAKKCGITSNSVGVPFLYDGSSKCYVGDVDVINFFKNAAKI